MSRFHRARGATQDEPKRHDRPEEAPDARAASALDHEETDQDGGSSWDDVFFEKRGDDVYTLDGA